jgi:hypothetical protein
MSQNEQNGRTGVSKSLKLSEMPQDMQDLMRQFDVDDSGGINVGDLHEMVHAYRDSKRQQRMLQKVLAVVALALVLSSASTLGVSYAAVTLAKDTEPNADGVIVLRGNDENRPALSPELTITDGVETVDVAQGLARRLQNGLAQNQTSVTVVTITESKVAQACHLFHQGAASSLVISIDDQDYRVSPTRFHHSCMTAGGSFDNGLWSLDCPGDGQVCDVSVIMPHRRSVRRLYRTQGSHRQSEMEAFGERFENVLQTKVELRARCSGCNAEREAIEAGVERHDRISSSVEAMLNERRSAFEALKTR